MVNSPYAPEECDIIRCLYIMPFCSVLYLELQPIFFFLQLTPSQNFWFFLIMFLDKFKTDGNNFVYITRPRFPSYGKINNLNQDNALFEIL